MPWNYRIFHTSYTNGGGDVDHDFTIREVHYDAAGGIVFITAKGIAPAGTTHANLRKDHALMQGAFRRPVLTPADIPGYRYEPGEIHPEEAGAPSSGHGDAD